MFRKKIKKESKQSKIDFENFKDVFIDFLENFRENALDPPKYLQVVTKMMENNYNIFHMYLKDIRKFNSNLGGFVACHSRKIESDIAEIIKKYIEDHDLGVLKHGLHFYIHGTK